MKLENFWNDFGIIPPVAGGGTAPERSPYILDLALFVDRFSFSRERCSILNGFLSFRQKLYSAGITSGIQWINGSFVENVEVMEERPPRDIDVITFYEPSEIGQNSWQIFDIREIKKEFCVDNYFVPLHPFEQSYSDYVQHIREVSYWYSLWSHKRDSTWKGFFQIELNIEADKRAKEVLGRKGDGSDD